MLREYEANELEKDDLLSRQDLLTSHPYAILIEAEHLELDSLKFWIKTNLRQEKLNWLYYGKTGYDFGIAEYFFSNPETANQVYENVPLIFTTYPNAYPKNKILRSNGYDQLIEFDQNDKSAIVIPAQEKD